MALPPKGMPAPRVGNNARTPYGGRDVIREEQRKEEAARPDGCSRLSLRGSLHVVGVGRKAARTSSIHHQRGFIREEGRVVTQCVRTWQAHCGLRAKMEGVYRMERKLKEGEARALELCHTLSSS